MVVLMYRKLNLAVMILLFTGDQEIKQPAAFLLNIMATPLRCASSSLPEYSRVSSVCVFIRPRPAHLHSLIPAPYFLISLATTAVFPILYIVLTFHDPIFMVDLGEANDLVSEQVSLRLAPAPVMSPSSHALEYGIDQLATCFDGVTSADVVKTVHLCCGYPNYLDEEGYKKADKDAYLRLADKLDAAGFDQISIEDAHRHNDLSLFEHFKKTKIVLGVVKVASSQVESVDEIRSRLKQVLTVFQPNAWSSLQIVD
ncbi:hypothetical protein OS493_031525 [Desmophyllum pertusum]|uniref:Cobalamin-independent methionine synthase MetE C-terminal/archaeal domain-containing protein n=1 Tax=Desmophyllum pertusum TaxID=174260 RepID=A0A9W9ZBE1_9CNID|nr:hypothetical protein OS493_031525 [Desmophyllum pertusum]